MKQSPLTRITLACAVSVSCALAGCGYSTARAPMDDTDMSQTQRSKMTLVVDPLTSCHYLYDSYGRQNSLTPRIDSDNKQICKAAEGTIGILANVSENLEFRTDFGTGCDYISYRGAITPRREPNGGILCKDFNKRKNTP